MEGKNEVVTESAVARTVDALMMESNGTGPNGNAVTKALSMVRSLAPRDIEAQVGLLVGYDLVSTEAVMKARNEAERASEALRRAQMRQDIVRHLVARIMSERDIKTLSLPNATVTLNAGRESIGVKDLALVSEEFAMFRKEASKSAAKDHLRTTGEVPAGFEVVIGAPYITVRRGA